MTLSEDARRMDERVARQLCGLYRRYGYSRYKMSKFEEYDLYARCKDFLVSEGVITFTDTNGRLMALKPDVTLSIVRNTRDGQSGVQKVYYNENVYRVSRGTNAYKEIAQVGLECIGELGMYEMCEAVMLAVRSLKCIRENVVLDLAHVGYLSALMEEMEVPDQAREEMMRAIGRKSLHEIVELCRRYDVSPGTQSALEVLSRGACGAEESLEALRRAARGRKMTAAVAELAQIYRVLAENGMGDCVNVDFSVAGNMKYYSGVVFQGFVEGVPDSVLSGGRYDKLMAKMGRKSAAVGFAVYLDMLERLDESHRTYDADVCLLYGEDVPPSSVLRRADAIAAAGETVLAARSLPEGMRFGRVERMEGGEARG